MIFDFQVLTIYVVLLRVYANATLETKVTIFDQSKSQYCLSGLLPGYDNIQLEIHVVSRKVNVICQIDLDSVTCNETTQDGCFCRSRDKLLNLYVLAVRLPARRQYSLSDVQVTSLSNGVLTKHRQSVKLPLIDSQLSINFHVDGKLLDIFPFKNVSVKLNSPHLIQVCTTLMSSQKQASVRWQCGTEVTPFTECVETTLELITDNQSLCIENIKTCDGNNSLQVLLIGPRNNCENFQLDPRLGVGEITFYQTDRQIELIEGRPEISITDVSKSKTCSTGLMANSDYVQLRLLYDAYNSSKVDHIDIQAISQLEIDDHPKTINKGYEMVTNSESLVHICRISLRPCPTMGTSQCFCSCNVDHVYHLTVNVTAQLEFSRGFMLAVLSPTANYDDTLLLGRRIQLKKFYVKGSESATLLYEGIDLLADKCSSNFTVISGKTLTFCMYDIDHPAISLFVNSNHTQTSMSGDCLKSKIQLEAGSNHLVYSYIDSCRRRGSYECTIWSSTIASVNISVTPDTIEEIAFYLKNLFHTTSKDKKSTASHRLVRLKMSSSIRARCRGITDIDAPNLTEGWTFIWYILLAMVVVNVVFILYCYKIGACCFSDCGDDIPLIIFQDVSQGEGRLQPKDAIVKYSSSLGVSSVSDSVDLVFKHVRKIKLNSSRSDIIIGKR